MKKIIYTLSLVFAVAGSAFAVELPGVMKQAMVHETGMPSLLNLVVSMVLVIAMIYATGWIYNKLNIVNRDKLNKMNAKGIDANRFNVIQTMPLGQNRHLYSIEMNGKIILIGSTPSHINVLKEFALDETDTDKQILDNSDESKLSTSKRNIEIDELYKKYKN